MLARFPLKPFTAITLGSRVSLRSRDFTSSRAKGVFIKAKLLASILISVEVLILYLLRDNLYKIVKYLLLSS